MPFHSEKGFSLVEMAVATTLTGILISAGALILSTMLLKRAESVTFERMEIVADAISLYAQQHMRIPCPADPNTGVGHGSEPFGAEWGSNAAGTGFGGCFANQNQREGIVPYVTLGLPQEYVRDKWGNYFTYRVSGAAALDPTAANLDTTSVGLWCLTQPVWNDGTDHQNVPKAAFCCGVNTGTVGSGNDIILTGPHGALPTPSRTAPGSGGEADDYAQPNAGSPNVGALQNRFTPLYPAYVLVSHGQNGLGAYNNGAHDPAPAAIPNPSERENANGDITFFVSDRLSPALPSASGGTDLFRPQIDDIVFWQSQAQVMSRLGETSCARPWNE